MTKRMIYGGLCGLLVAVMVGQVLVIALHLDDGGAALVGAALGGIGWIVGALPTRRRP